MLHHQTVQCNSHSTALFNNVFSLKFHNLSRDYPKNFQTSPGAIHQQNKNRHKADNKAFSKCLLHQDWIGCSWLKHGSSSIWQKSKVIINIVWVAAVQCVVLSAMHPQQILETFSSVCTVWRWWYNCCFYIASKILTNSAKITICVLSTYICLSIY